MIRDHRNPVYPFSIAGDPIKSNKDLNKVFKKTHPDKKDIMYLCRLHPVKQGSNLLNTD
jgi:hypothetical protein